MARRPGGPPPQNGPRLYVYVPWTNNYAYVDASSVDPVCLADRGEALAECAAAENERLVAGRECVRDRGLESRRARCGEEQNVVLRAEEILQSASQGREQRGELGTAVIYQRSRRRGEDRLRNECRTWDAEVLRTVH